MDKITTTEIETRVAGYFNYRKNIIVPNVSWGIGLHECDLLVIRDSGYAIEVEIKISKSDLRADAKKEHHHLSNRIKELYFAIPDYLEDCIEYIPERAGVLVLSRYQGGLSCYTKRKAKFNLNCRKFTQEEQLKVAHLGTMRIWNLKRQIKRETTKRKKERSISIKELQQDFHFAW
jgi:hypothetical protein